MAWEQEGRLQNNMGKKKATYSHRLSVRYTRCSVYHHLPPCFYKPSKSSRMPCADHLIKLIVGVILFVNENGDFVSWVKISLRYWLFKVSLMYSSAIKSVTSVPLYLCSIFTCRRKYFVNCFVWKQRYKRARCCRGLGFFNFFDNILIIFWNTRWTEVSSLSNGLASTF